MLVRVKGNVIFQKTNTVNVTDLKKTGLECGAKRDFVPKLGYPSGRIFRTDILGPLYVKTVLYLHKISKAKTVSMRF